MIMNRSNFILVCCSLLLMFLTLPACEKEGLENETKISSFGSSESHNTGENCMQCHARGGGGEGWFTAAGTAYNSNQSQVFPNATVRLYTGPQGSGTLVHTIYGDRLGNFYTTEKIDYSGGLYPAIEGATGTQYMPDPVTHGDCNSCHGNSTDRLWAR